MTVATQRLCEIRLYGHLRRHFGKSHLRAISSGGEAVRALCATLPGFRQYLAQHNAPGYRVWRGTEAVRDTAELAWPAGGLVRIVPVTAGAGGGGLGRVLLGVSLISMSVWMGPGAMPILGGVTSVSGLAMNFGIDNVLGSFSGDIR